MDEALNTVIENIADALEECARLLESPGDHQDFGLRLCRLSTALVRGAFLLRVGVVGEEEAASDLATDMFYEVFSSMREEDRSRFRGEALFHMCATMSMDGVAPCQDWVVQYSAAPR